MINFLYTVFLLVMFIFDEIIYVIVPTDFSKLSVMIIPSLLIMGIVMMHNHMERKSLLYFAFITGVVFDVVYTDALFIYATTFLLIAYIFSYVRNTYLDTFFSSIIVLVVAVIFKEFSVYVLSTFGHRTNLGLENFIHLRLIPTTIMAIFSAPIVYVVYRRFMKSIKIYLERLEAS